MNAPDPAPALSGGTLLILSDGRTAVASDPDGDAVHFVDLRAERLLGSVRLEHNDEPGRLVEDAAGRVHVALRRGGAVVSIDSADRHIIERRVICGDPRGVAADAAKDQIVVACAGGEVVTLPAAGGPATSTLRLPRDLRDVVVSGDRLLISSFRSAELLVVARDSGAIVERRVPPGSSSSQQLLGPGSARPSMRRASVGVAWRMRALADGKVAMVHQEGSNDDLSTDPGGYSGGPCKSVMGASVTTFAPDGTAVTGGQIIGAVLPLDIAYSTKSPYMAVISAAANDSPARFPSQRVNLISTKTRSSSDVSRPGEPVPVDCVFPGTVPDDGIIQELRQPVGLPVAVAFDGDGRVVVQTRSPGRIEIVSNKGGMITFGDQSRDDTGQQIFHMATGSGVACASCHPEGGDDGRVWNFQKLGARRTQNLLGGILGTAPFHWDGDLKDMGTLMQAVFTGRMAGPALTDAQVAALGAWIDKRPTLKTPAPLDASAVDRGKALFNDSKVACASCHSGDKLTNNQSTLIGKGAATQVPGLRNVGFRAPFMHDGCAATLADRFDSQCGGTMHGSTASLSKAQIADLVAYLDSL